MSGINQYEIREGNQEYREVNYGVNKSDNYKNRERKQKYRKKFEDNGEKPSMFLVSLETGPDGIDLLV